MGLIEVQQQLLDYCPCYEGQSLEDLDAIAAQLVKHISLSTCWTRNGCETLLYGDRQERIEMPCIDCNCCGNIERFRPYYQTGINFDDLKVTIVTQSGVTTESIEVDKSHYGLTDVKGYYEFLVDLDPYAESCSCRSCDLMYIVFDYKAGYEKLPECLFPEVCELAKTITASLMGCGDLDECCNKSQAELGYVLRTKKIGELSWSWSKDTRSVEYLYSQLVLNNQFKAYSMISLCGTSQSDYRRLWAVRNNPWGY